MNVESPIARKGRFKHKRNAVENAYSSFRQILKEFNIPCVKKTFGPGIVRVCCRSVVQLENITLIMKDILKQHLIEEIGMPLEYSYKMKSIVLFMKPTDKESSMEIDRIFQNCSFEYHHLVFDVEYPDTVARNTFEVCESSFCKIPHEKMIICVLKVIGLLILYHFFRT